MNYYNYIELFAGAGGLSLGLETAGFDLLLANELSPMASETFALNHLNADLENEQNIDKVFWISSQYPRSEISKRLRESPFEASGLSKNHFSDLINFDITNINLERSLLIGSIIDLNSLLENADGQLLDKFQSGFGRGSVDLISGGPPCQSFSLAGLRDHTNERNQMPWEFMRFVKQVCPKMVLLENVSGILRAFQINGEKYHAWYEVAKGFAKIGYIPLCLHINAKFVGVAQNRPRFIMLALRVDVCNSFIKNTNDINLKELFQKSKSFYERVDNASNEVNDLKYYDIEKHPYLFDEGILSILNSSGRNLVSVSEAIDDLTFNGKVESHYVLKINSKLHNRFNQRNDKLYNHDFRSNSAKVRARFRIYQILNKLNKADSKTILSYLKSDGLDSLPFNSLIALSKYWVVDIDGQRISKPTIEDLSKIISNLRTKKQTQRALIANQPAPAALSIPDDACHYSESEKDLRTLTVREMARIQSFPDWFKIRSKVTTGGLMRKYEVPQYTQIGNAVPPLLGLALGKVCIRILEEAEE